MAVWWCSRYCFIRSILSCVHLREDLPFFNSISVPLCRFRRRCLTAAKAQSPSLSPFPSPLSLAVDSEPHARTYYHESRRERAPPLLTSQDKRYMHTRTNGEKIQKEYGFRRLSGSCIGGWNSGMIKNLSFSCPLALCRRLDGGFCFRASRSSLPTGVLP